MNLNIPDTHFLSVTPALCPWSAVLDTGVATPSPYREADFQQFHPQIGERGTSRQEEREEEVHAADGEARTEGSEEVEEETQLIVLDPEHVRSVPCHLCWKSHKTEGQTGLQFSCTLGPFVKCCFYKSFNPPGTPVPSVVTWGMDKQTHCLA